MVKYRYLFVLLILLAAATTACGTGDSPTEPPPTSGSSTEPEPTQGQGCTATQNSSLDGGDLINPTIRLVRMRLDGELTEIGALTVPISGIQDMFYFLNILADLNQDGVWDTSEGLESEWLTRNAPILIFETSQTTYFPLPDSPLEGGDSVALRVVVGEAPIPSESEWDCEVPSNDTALDSAVDLIVIDTESVADPAEGYMGAGLCTAPSSDYGFVELLPPMDDLNLESIFYRPGVPDTDQGRNTCVGHSMANSLSWLAQQNGFTDKFQQAKDAQGNELDSYDVTTAEGVNEMAWEMISDWADKGEYTPSTGVSTNAIISGKQSFIDKRGLPVTVEQIGSEDGSTTFEAIKEALKAGCDVEVGIRIQTERGSLGHMVTAVGFSDVMIGDTPYSGLTFHDPGTSSETSGPGGGNDLYQYDPKTHSIRNYPFEGKLRTATLSFAVKECYTPPKVSMSGTYGVEIQVALDMLNHAIHILMPGTMNLSVRQGSIVFEGDFPWITVAGEVDDDGVFEASGQGTVAGFPGIAVTFAGSIQDEHLEGDYIMGAAGGLPGGEPITYHVEGDRTGPLDSETSAEAGKTLVEQFYDRFNDQFNAGSDEGLLFLLHPAVVELYGAEACQAYLTQVAQNPVQIQFLSATGPDVWIWEIDDRSIEIEEAFIVHANVIAGGSTAERDLHIARDENGLLKWFTDCGDPLE